MKSLSIFLYSIWEWILMIIGIFVFLFSVYLIIYPNGFIFNSLPLVFLDFLGIESFKSSPTDT
jgi:hypothetical protein